MTRGGVSPVVLSPSLSTEARRIEPARSPLARPLGLLALPHVREGVQTNSASIGQAKVALGCSQEVVPATESS